MPEIHESYEDYLKAIYIISKRKKGGWVSNSEISELLGVRPSSVTGMLYNLKNQELVDWTPRKSLRLTSKGKKVAMNTINKYKELKHFFIHVLKMKNNSKLDEICCKIEHHITPEVLNALEDLAFEK
ncbi:MAG: metal-dependent transcriptional regulator [Promethearchaeota archaeon]